MILFSVSLATLCFWWSLRNQINSEHGSIALLSLGSLSKVSDSLSGIGKEVQEDLYTNSQLQKQLQDGFGADSENCHCDCSKSADETKVKAATMLDQVGEVKHRHFFGPVLNRLAFFCFNNDCGTQDVFFGPCAGCPCMRSSGIGDVIARVADEYKVDMREI